MRSKAPWDDNKDDTDDKPNQSAEEKSTDERLVEILERLAERAAASGLTSEQLQQVLHSAGVTSAEAMRQSLRPENADHPHISAFFTESDRLTYGTYENKPKLTRKTFFCGVEEKDERLTPSEIEGYNRISDNRSARHGRWAAEIRRNGRADELHVWVPCSTLEERMQLRPLLLIQHELNGGASTEDLGALLQELQRVRALAASKGATAAELERTLVANT